MKWMTTIVIIACLFLSVPVFFRLAPQFGSASKDERLKRIQSSPNFRNGRFINPVSTNMDTPPASVMKEFLKKEEGRRPSSLIQNTPIDKHRYETASNSEILVTWLGHSTVLFRIGGKTFISDPVFRKRASVFSFLGPKKFPYKIEYTVDDLPKIDAVILSHDHYDHLDYKFIEKIKDKAVRFYAPLGVGAHLERWGVDPAKITELDWEETSSFGSIELTATPGRHFTGRKMNDRFATLWCGWVIRNGDQKIFFTGDSGYFDGFKTIGEKYGPFDIAFIECGQYNLAWHAIHMLPEESAQAGADLKAKLAMPIHWGKFKLSVHGWTEPPTRFSDKANELGLAFTTPVIGETFSPDQYPTGLWWKD